MRTRPARWAITLILTAAAVPRDATVTVRLDSGDVVWLDYMIPGQTRS